MRLLLVTRITLLQCWFLSCPVLMHRRRTEWRPQRMCRRQSQVLEGILVKKFLNTSVNRYSFHFEIVELFNVRQFLATYAVKLWPRTVERIHIHIVWHFICQLPKIGPRWNIWSFRHIVGVVNVHDAVAVAV